MSDGITEARRASDAHERGDQLFNDAAAHYMLLVEETKNVERGDALKMLFDLCGMMTCRAYDGFKVDVEGYGSYYDEFYRDKYNGTKSTQVKVHEVQITCSGVTRTFKEASVDEVITEALTFCRILKTDMGQKAADAYNDY